LRILAVSRFIGVIELNDKRRTLADRGLLRFELLLWLVVIMSLGGCFLGTKGSKKDLDEYDACKQAADDALVRGDYDEVVKQLNCAEQIAENTEWNDGKVMVKSTLGQMYLIRKMSVQSEAAYLEAKEFCRQDSSCNDLLLQYNWLFWLYAYDMHDSDKARALIEEVIQEAPRVTREKTLRTILNDYAAKLRGGGMEADALWVGKRIAELPSNVK